MKKSFTDKLKAIGGTRPQPRDEDFAEQIGINQKQTMTMLSLEVILPNPKNPRRSRRHRNLKS